MKDKTTNCTNLHEGEILYKELCYEIVGAAMEVHAYLGPGFLEAVYNEALGIELDKRNISYEKEKELRIDYKGIILEKNYKADLVVDEKILVELKTVSRLTNVEYAQVINYLKCTGLRLGLLINFHAPSLEWKRLAV